MDKLVFDAIALYVKEICGISLGIEKMYLIEQRLSPILHKLEVSSFEELSKKLTTTTDSYVKEQLIIAITTNETSFFRDLHPYEMFYRKIVPELIEKIKDRKEGLYVRRGPKVAIWSAACSTGQEPYSIAMKINTYLESNKSDVDYEDFRILGTDINSRVLSHAISGKYTESELKRGLYQHEIAKYFHKDDDVWVAKEELRRIVDFQSLNLTMPFKHIGSFDVVFCRNILIYFDEETKLRIFEQIHEMLAPEGILILGAAESMSGVDQRFIVENYNGSYLYRKLEIS